MSIAGVPFGGAVQKLRRLLGAVAATLGRPRAAQASDHGCHAPGRPGGHRLRHRDHRFPPNGISPAVNGSTAAGIGAAAGVTTENDFKL